MPEKITKKVIQETIDRLNRASVSPEEKLKLLKEINLFVERADSMAKDIIKKIKKI